MKLYLLEFKNWYVTTRKEYKIAVVVAMLFGIFLIFNFLFINAQHQKLEQLRSELVSLEKSLLAWQQQVTTLQNFANSPLYKTWLQQRNVLQNIQNKYETLIKNSSNHQWKGVIENILKTESNLQVIKINNLPETLYQPKLLPKLPTTLYQQQLKLELLGNYFDTVDYLKNLETALPDLRWNSINYMVSTYPIAKIEMEFSIIYEKKK